MFLKAPENPGVPRNTWKDQKEEGMQMQLIIPKNYNPVLDLRDTEIAIKLVKDFFEAELSRALNLTRVSAPIMVTPESGLNDNLNGVERPVSFDIKETGRQAEIVHSLAKWKRQALKTYGFHPGEARTGKWSMQSGI